MDDIKRAETEPQGIKLNAVTVKTDKGDVRVDRDQVEALLANREFLRLTWFEATSRQEGYVWVEDRIESSASVANCVQMGHNLRQASIDAGERTDPHETDCDALLDFLTTKSVFGKFVAASLDPFRPITEHANRPDMQVERERDDLRLQVADLAAELANERERKEKLRQAYHATKQELIAHLATKLRQDRCACGDMPTAGEAATATAELAEYMRHAVIELRTINRHAAASAAHAWGLKGLLVALLVCGIANVMALNQATRDLLSLQAPAATAVAPEALEVFGEEEVTGFSEAE